MRNHGQRRCGCAVLHRGSHRTPQAPTATSLSGESFSPVQTLVASQRDAANVIAASGEVPLTKKGISAVAVRGDRKLCVTAGWDSKFVAAEAYCDFMLSCGVSDLSVWVWVPVQGQAVRLEEASATGHPAPPHRHCEVCCV